jgi:hypothetical protein
VAAELEKTHLAGPVGVDQLEQGLGLLGRAAREA